MLSTGPRHEQVSHHPTVLHDTGHFTCKSVTTSRASQSPLQFTCKSITTSRASQSPLHFTSKSVTTPLHEQVSHHSTSLQVSHHSTSLQVSHHPAVLHSATRFSFIDKKFDILLKVQVNVKEGKVRLVGGGGWRVGMVGVG